MRILPLTALIALSVSCGAPPPLPEQKSLCRPAVMDLGPLIPYNEQAVARLSPWPYRSARVDMAATCPPSIRPSPRMQPLKAAPVRGSV